MSTNSSPSCGARGCLEAIARGPALVAWAAERGCRASTGVELAALADQGEAVALQAFARAGRALGVGIGLQSGPVVSGCLGSGARLEFTVLGDTVNTASRLQALTKETGEQVLIGAGTVALLESGPTGLVRLGEIPVRGRDRPVEVHALRQ